ncbi:hypothetical protein [Paenibacillus glacialis]|nr:hypothetical protein [Paenibacillus glacialis]
MEAAIITTFLTSTVIATLISSYVAKISNDKNMSLKYITEERSVWRKVMRETTSKICSGKYDGDDLKELATMVMVSLNPLVEKGNKLDLYIIKLLKEIEKGDPDKQILDEFRDCVSVLLKHDWERSKNETKTLLFRDPESYIKKRTLGKFYEETEKDNSQIESR